MARQSSAPPDYSGFYGDDVDPDPDQINELDEVSKMPTKVLLPSKKATPKPSISGPVERESEDEIVDGRKWSREETFTLLDIMKIMLPQFSLPNVKKATLWKKMAEKMKKQGIFNRSDADCSAKWRNLKQRYHKLTSPLQNKSSQRQAEWPFMAKMDVLLKNNPVVTLEQVAEVVDGEVREAKGITLAGRPEKKL
ncbi:uncharacterized protein LOC116923872 [Daphnia magna]|nr:uncharacterized protein LOC116923872 [Daphnia magna]